MLFVKKINFGLLLLVSIIFALACGQQRSPNDRNTDRNIEQKSVTEQAPTSVAAEELPPPPAKIADEAYKDKAAAPIAAPEKRQFLRTAEFRFRVKDVHRTEQNLEAIVQKWGGFVTNANLQTSTNETILAPYTTDSLLETTIYTVENNTTVRIPNQHFDTLLTQIDRMVAHLDYRKLSADDVSLQLLANKMRTQRGRELAGSLRRAIDKNGKKLGEVIAGEAGIAETQNAADDAAMSNLNLTDRVAFSTVSLNIYQHEVVAQEVVANTNAQRFHANFFRNFVNAISVGWYGLLEVVLVLAQAWTFWLALAAGIWLFRRYRKAR